MNVNIKLEVDGRAASHRLTAPKVPCKNAAILNLPS